MTADEIKADIKAVSAGVGVALLLAQGTVKPVPTDLETMHQARDAFARLRIELESRP